MRVVVFDLNYYMRINPVLHEFLHIRNNVWIK